ncbi:MAG: SUMF1/EgtB/PvdO family nonheme iron enzyme [Myxococcales bacterium]|nr:SUMF1/EgtB/PvdO family nonheme iron enzyme [Myxococcales bacterium]
MMSRGALLAALALVLACGGEPSEGAGGHDEGGGGEARGGAGPGAGGGGASSATGGAGGETMAEPDGSWAHPYPLELPDLVSGSTLDAVSSDADSYFPCAPQTPEPGPEVVYEIEVPEAGWLWARIDDMPGDALDVDLHLLKDATPDACITRHDLSLGAPVQPGRHYLVVDTWQDASYAGAYTLEVGLTTEAGACLISPIECDGMLAPFVNPPFVNPGGLEAPGDAGCLPGMARVEDFCIDRYEATVVAFDGSDWLPVSPFAHPDDGAVLSALSLEGVTPQGHISQLQADDACAMAGKRLCDDAEWLRACRGPTTTTYPYGSSLMPGVCNDDRECHPVVQLFESSDSWVWSELGDPCISQLPEGLALTGEYQGCATTEGVMDMMGNLHEWTADPAGTFRGGFYVDTVINGPGCLYATTAHNVAHHDYSTGFRCCADATP